MEDEKNERPVKRLRIGVIANTHGIKGEAKILK